jgi:hypothetical protein
MIGVLAGIRVARHHDADVAGALRTHEAID